MERTLVSAADIHEKLGVTVYFWSGLRNPNEVNCAVSISEGICVFEFLLNSIYVSEHQAELR